MVGDFAIAFSIFSRLGTYLLLVVVVWAVNASPRQRLGSDHVVFKVLPLAIVGVMGALFCAYTGLSSWNILTATPAGAIAGARYREEGEQLYMAYYGLYLAGVLAGAVISFKTLFSMRSRHIPVGVSRSLIPTLCTLPSEIV